MYSIPIAPGSPAASSRDTLRSPIAYFLAAGDDAITAMNYNLGVGNNAYVTTGTGSLTLAGDKGVRAGGFDNVIVNLGDNSGGAVKVDVESAMATTKSVAGVVADMQETIGRIARASSNGAASWQGKASAAFTDTHADWNSSALALHNALDDIRNKLSSGFAGYDDNDAQIAGGFHPGGVRL